MEKLISKKIILWASVSLSMALVVAVWMISWQNYDIAGSKKQAQELRDKVQDNLKQINAPKLDASILLLPLEE